jgi:hypothetical protein
MNSNLLEIDSEESIKTSDIKRLSDSENESDSDEEIINNIGMSGDSQYIIELIEIKREEMTEDEFGIKPIPVIKKSTYNQAQKIAIDKYRKSHPEIIRKVQKKNYEKIKANPEKRERFKKSCSESQKRKVRRIKAERIEKGEWIGGGRPKKELTPEEIEAKRIKKEKTEAYKLKIAMNKEAKEKKAKEDAEKLASGEYRLIEGRVLKIKTKGVPVYNKPPKEPKPVKEKKVKVEKPPKPPKEPKEKKPKETKNLKIIDPELYKEKKKEWNRKYRIQIEENLRKEKEQRIASGEVIKETRGRKKKVVEPEAIVISEEIQKIIV